jgi:hypothetical protein
MPRKRCGLGFSCALMMQQPGLDPGDCPNHQVCGLATELTPEEEIELIRFCEQKRQRFWATRQEAAVMMLMMRGNPQTADSLGLTTAIAQLMARLDHLRSRIETSTRDHYIAPPRCEVHRYSVKRLWGTYGYNKLTSKEAVFEPSVEEQQVKVIHLSHDDDPRYQEARLGIRRRNQLLQMITQIQSATANVEAAIGLLQEFD